MTKIDQWFLAATFVFSLPTYRSFSVPPHYFSVLGLVRSMVKINVKNICTVNLPVVIQFLARRGCNEENSTHIKHSLQKRDKETIE